MPCFPPLYSEARKISPFARQFNQAGRLFAAARKADPSNYTIEFLFVRFADRADASAFPRFGGHEQPPLLGGNPVLASSLATRKENTSKARAERNKKLKDIRAQLAQRFSRVKEALEHRKSNLVLEKKREELERRLMFEEDILLRSAKKRRQSKMVLLGKSQADIARERKIMKRKSRIMKQQSRKSLKKKKSTASGEG